MSDITDIRPAVAAERNRVEIPTDGDPRDFTVDQMQQVVQSGQANVQEYLTQIPNMLIALVNEAQNLGSMRMLLAQKMEQEANDDHQT